MYWKFVADSVCECAVNGTVSSVKKCSVVVSVLLSACLALPVANASENDPRNGQPGTAAECSQFHWAVDMGTAIPNLQNWWINPPVLRGNTLKIHSQTQQYEYLLKAFDMWNEATDNLINFELVDYDGDDVATVYDVTPAQLPNALGVFTYATGDIGLNLAYTTDVKSKIFVIAHELGHAMGLGHTCTGDLMVGVGNSAFEVTRYDAELLRQTVEARG